MNTIGKIGFIGLGKMGLPMALNLRKAGFDLLICSGNPQSAAKMTEAGAKTISSYSKLANQSDIVITIVPADKEILELYTSEDGLVSNMKDGAICIDMTSAKGSTKRAVAEYAADKGKLIHVIDAPVSGGVPGAEAGTLTIMAGCEKELFDKCAPVFEAMGKKIVHTGGLGSASDIKMLNQMLNAGNNAVVCEVLCVAKTLGVDMDIMYDIINESSGGSYVFKNNVQKFMLSGDHTPGFRLDLMKKDIGLFIESAHSAQAFTPMAELVYQVYKASSNKGYGDSNTTSIFKWYEGNQK